ncbi:MAG: hypothetical protein WBD33_16520, partial [Xanthobacteraceae bacterium]
LRDLDAPDFEGAAFRALESVYVPAGAFALDTEQAQFDLALRASQRGFHDYLSRRANHDVLSGCRREHVRSLSHRRLGKAAAGDGLNVDPLSLET